jgi:pimeloyl-ACP methyl ester carboxylesterase
MSFLENRQNLLLLQRLGAAPHDFEQIFRGRRQVFWESAKNSVNLAISSEGKIDMTESSHREIFEKEHEAGGIFFKEVSPIEPKPDLPPILMVHGACHGWWAFEKWLPYFASRGWRSYALSLSNHPGSHKVPPGEYLRLTVNDYVEDVLNVTHRLDAPPVLLGHSMGGIVAQKAAGRTNLRALALICSVGPGQLGRMRDPLPLDHGVLPSRSAVREMWFHQVDEKSLDAVCRRLVPESPSVINEYSAGVAINREAIRCPVIVVSAEHDGSAVHTGRALADFFRTELIVIPESGHDLMLGPEALKAAEVVEGRLRSLL